ncbi:MAG: MaoC family dehydratase N-terminal domain-containing protein [Burkholderiaceae bacterium]|nr:MaoC family dehydratase N-terminal domain-containing protein [Burkholderiaceae bacterium]
MLDTSLRGKKLPAHTFEVEKGRLRFFAKATGQTDPVYTDEAAAHRAGYPSLPVPPTFFFCMGMESPHFHDFHNALRLNMQRILHGEQSFVYHRMAFAGDRLTFEPEIADVYDKRNGALEFAVKHTRVTNARGEHVADLREVLVQPGNGRASGAGAQA